MDIQEIKDRHEASTCCPCDDCVVAAHNDIGLLLKKVERLESTLAEVKRELAPYLQNQ
jgi:hypothetical protein